jgi:hypothetical protein
MTAGSSNARCNGDPLPTTRALELQETDNFAARGHRVDASVLV